MGDWEELFKEWAETDISHGGFFRQALIEIETLRALLREMAGALESCYDDENMGLRDKALAHYKEMMK
jgi:hypothetical protein